MDMKLLKRGLSFILCLAMVLGNVPATVFSVETDGLCAHHTEHVDCGYEDGISACGFECAQCAAEAAAEETDPPVVETDPPVSETKAPTQPPVPEETAAPTEAPTELPVPEETAAPTEAPTEPPVPETEAPTEPVEETTAPTNPVEETTAPTEAVEEETPVTFVEPQTVKPGVELPDDDELYAAYAEQVLYGSSFSLLGTAAGERLQGDEKMLYDLLVPFFKDVANGRRESTVLAVGTTITDQNGTTYTPEVETTFESQTISKESMGRVMDAILSDLPFEAYWFDKTTGFRFSYLYLETIQYMEMSFHVSWNYCGAFDFTVNTDKTGAAVDAAANAQYIVSEYAAATDY